MPYVAREHSRHITVPDGWGERWSQAKRDARTRRVNVDIWGDSAMVQGLGSSNQNTTSIPALIQLGLHGTLANGGTGFKSHEYAVGAAGWTTGEYGGFAGTSVRATNAQSLQWTGMVGTDIRLYCRNTNVTGEFRWRIDGGNWSNVIPPNPFTGEVGIVTSTVADGLHTIDVEWVSGTVFIHGCSARRSTGIVVNRFGQVGRAASHYSPMVLERIPLVGTTDTSATITTPGAGSFRNLHIGKYITGTGIPVDATITAVASAISATISAAATATGTITADVQHNRPSLADSPNITTTGTVLGTELGLGRADVVILGLGANDAITNADMDAATFREGASRILKGYSDGTEYNYTPDLVVVVEHLGNATDVRDRFVEVVSEAKSFAAAWGGAVIDVWGIGRRNFKYWDDLGMFYVDDVHPNDPGCRQYANPILDLLLNV